jgi:hypothetical protein
MGGVWGNLILQRRKLRFRRLIGSLKVTAKVQSQNLKLDISSTICFFHFITVFKISWGETESFTNFKLFITLFSFSSLCHYHSKINAKYLLTYFSE